MARTAWRAGLAMVLSVVIAAASAAVVSGHETAEPVEVILTATNRPHHRNHRLELAVELVVEEALVPDRVPHSAQ